MAVWAYRAQKLKLRKYQKRENEYIGRSGNPDSYIQYGNEHLVISSFQEQKISALGGDCQPLVHFSVDRRIGTIWKVCIFPLPVLAAYPQFESQPNARNPVWCQDDFYS